MHDTMARVPVKIRGRSRKALARGRDPQSLQVPSILIVGINGELDLAHHDGHRTASRARREGELLCPSKTNEPPLTSPNARAQNHPYVASSAKKELELARGRKLTFGRRTNVVVMS